MCGEPPFTLPFTPSVPLTPFCKAIDTHIPLMHTHNVYKCVPSLTYLPQQDVAAERARVESGSADGNVLVVKELCKVYPPRRRKEKPFTAVKNMSVGIAAQECFGLLGVNGAGKTTTFKVCVCVWVGGCGCGCVSSLLRLCLWVDAHVP